MSNVHSLSLLRFAALGAGVYYGFSRYAALSKQDHHDHDAPLLLEEARIAYQAQRDRQQAEKAKKDGVIIDSDHYLFSGDKWAEWAQRN